MPLSASTFPASLHPGSGDERWTLRYRPREAPFGRDAVALLLVYKALEEVLFVQANGFAQDLDVSMAGETSGATLSEPAPPSCLRDAVVVAVLVKGHDGR